MYPTIKSGSYLIVEKYGYGHYGSFGITIQKLSSSKTINKGDIVIFQFPPDPSIFFVKRVIGLPGDLIQYKNKELHINEVAVETEKIFNLDGYEIFREVVGANSYQIAHARINSVDTYEYRVPKDCLFVMGDNRDHSIDSRSWGIVPISHLVGKVKYILTSTKEDKVVRANQ
jgi:signal peptidase I